MNATAEILFRPPAPAPRKKPLGFFGMLHTLRNNPIEIWTEDHFRKTVLIGSSAFGVRAVINDPAAVKRIFLDNAANYPKDELQLRVLRPGLGRGLLTAEGEDWRAMRRALAPLFTPRQVAAFAPAMDAAVCDCVENIRKKRDGRVLDMSQEMARLTLAALERTLFSTGLGRNADEFQRAVTAFLDTAGRLDPLDLLGLPDFLPRIGRMRGRKTIEWFAQTVRDIVETRRALIASGKPAPRDILSLLLEAQDPESGKGLSEEDLYANIITFINAGHETTANALTWTLYLLSQSPQWLERVETEAAEALANGAIETLADRMPVAKAVLEESMRLYPPAAILTRGVLKAEELAGVTVPPGAIVTVSPYVLHRHQTLWRDPDRFDPTRFLPENRESIDRFAYIPFGAGPRICIGMGFAMQEMSIALARLTSAFRFELQPGHTVKPMQRITLRPLGGMPMIVRHR
ncbi:MAG: cytochrome P450 [Hyphomicrobiales bacterium]|nr:cytochrome P450 [Hyphomicrobiales bacterium]